MAEVAKRAPRAADVFGRLDQMFDEWVRAMPFRPMNMEQWRSAGELIPVEEFHGDGGLVVRAELPGVDPDKDIELTVTDGMLRIQAERRQEEKHQEHDYLRQELRYGWLSRTLPLPAGSTEADIKATYKDGILEVRIPEPRHQPAAKIPIGKP